ncbi:MAG: PEP-CTERM sorting domain-containing protein [Planctomycetota bacterium]|jgi:hypothetical protein
MKAKTVKLAAAVSLLALCCVARADILELPLNCPGVYDSNTPAWTSDFDLGATFTEISHVYIDWAGEITAGLAIIYDNSSDPVPKEVGIGASLGANPYLRAVSIWGGEGTYPDPEAFDSVSEFELVGGSTWSDLIDGRGSITIEYEELIIPGSYIEHGSVDLTSATLVVDGTVVPEPATLLLLAIGTTLVRGSTAKTRHERQVVGGVR